MLVFDCAIKLLSLIMKSLAQVSIDMVVAIRQPDDENRRLLNSCQCVNTGHKLVSHGKSFSCSIFLLRMILPLSLAWRQVHYLKNGNGAGHQRILSSQEDFNDCGMRVLCEGRRRALHRWRYRFDLPRMPHENAACEKKLKLESYVEQQFSRKEGLGNDRRWPQW